MTAVGVTYCRGMSGTSACALASLGWISPPRCICSWSHTAQSSRPAIGSLCMIFCSLGRAAKHCCVTCSREAPARTGRTLRIRCAVSTGVSLTTTHQSASMLRSPSFAARVVCRTASPHHLFYCKDVAKSQRRALGWIWRFASLQAQESCSLS